MFSRHSATSRPFESIASGSDVGCVREHNEDAVRVNENAGLLVVADGMGGRAAGEVASRIVADVMESAVVGQDEDMVAALVGANGAVLKAAQDGRGAPGMGSTCVACRPLDEGLEVAWVGDSRAYRMRHGELDRLSHDHSYVQTLVDAGVITAADAEHHPERNILSICVGNAGLDRSEIGHAVHSLEPGDRILLCSDGLTTELSDSTIARVLQGATDDEMAVSTLIEMARSAGGHDNISVVVATR